MPSQPILLTSYNEVSLKGWSKVKLYEQLFLKIRFEIIWFSIENSKFAETVIFSLIVITL